MIWGKKLFSVTFDYFVKHFETKSTKEERLNLNSPVKIIQTIVLTPDFVIFYLIGLINTNDMSA